MTPAIVVALAFGLIAAAAPGAAITLALCHQLHREWRHIKRSTITAKFYGVASPQVIEQASAAVNATPQQLYHRMLTMVHFAAMSMWASLTLLSVTVSVAVFGYDFSSMAANHQILLAALAATVIVRAISTTKSKGNIAVASLMYFWASDQVDKLSVQMAAHSDLQVKRQLQQRIDAARKVRNDCGHLLRIHSR